MATFDNAWAGFVSGLNVISDIKDKYIIAASSDGSSVYKMKATSLLYNDDDIVDLGLPSGTVWAKKNLCATSQTNYGLYFSWGETTPYNNAAARNAALNKSGGFDSAAYNATGASSISANLSDAQDAAHVLLGSYFKIPTQTQFAELFNTSNVDYINSSGTVISSTNKITTLNGVSGLYLRSKTNGNTIFFPCAGCYNGVNASQIGSQGYYFSSTYYSSSYAKALTFTSSTISTSQNNYRYYGLPIRAVI